MTRTDLHTWRPLALGTALLALTLLFGGAATALVQGSNQDAGGETAAEEEAGTGVITLFLIRHAEKGKDDPRNPSLNEAGQARATEVARLFGSTGITHLLSTDYKRTRQTLEPLAKQSGLEIASYDPRRAMDALAKLPDGAVAVVAGHSNTTPGLYAALGAGTAASLEDSSYGKVIPESQYDRLYCVTVKRAEGGEFECVSGYELRFGAPSAR